MSHLGLENFHDFFAGKFPEILEILKEWKILLIDTFSSYKMLTAIENWLIL